MSQPKLIEKEPQKLDKETYPKFVNSILDALCLNHQMQNVILADRFIIEFEGVEQRSIRDLVGLCIKQANKKIKRRELKSREEFKDCVLTDYESLYLFWVGKSYIRLAFYLHHGCYLKLDISQVKVITTNIRNLSVPLLIPVHLNTYDIFKRKDGGLNLIDNTTSRTEKTFDEMLEVPFYNISKLPFAFIADVIKNQAIPNNQSTF